MYIFKRGTVYYNSIVIFSFTTILLITFWVINPKRVVKPKTKSRYWKNVFCRKYCFWNYCSIQKLYVYHRLLMTDELAMTKCPHPLEVISIWRFQPAWVNWVSKSNSEDFLLKVSAVFQHTHCDHSAVAVSHYGYMLSLTFRWLYEVIPYISTMIIWSFTLLKIKEAT